MWMKLDQNKEFTDKSRGEGLLRCPMCKGRGYFEPTQVSNIKSSDCFSSFQSDGDKDNSVKLPQLTTKAGNKQWPRTRSKYSLPSINNVKNLPEHLPSFNNQSPKYKEKKTEELTSDILNKTDSVTKTGISQRLSVASSNDSTTEIKSLIPSPRTPKNPTETLKNSLSKLKTNNWNEALHALKELVQISRFQPQILEPSMVIIYRGLIFLLKSFRSIVVRTACQVANELFANIANTQRPEFDEMVNVLLQKTADSSKAIRQDANEALDTMILNIPPNHSVRSITYKGISHKSPLVRTTSARLLVCVVGIVGVDAIFNGNKETRGRILSAGATFMQDGNQEVRNFGRRLMKMLMAHDEFEEVLQANVNDILFKRIEKMLITMKYKF